MDATLARGSSGSVSLKTCSSKESSPGVQGLEASLKGEASEFMARLWKLVEEGDRFTDVKVIFADGQQICAHSIVLAAVSPFFQAMLSTEMREKSRGVIKLPTISQPTFKRVLAWSFGREVAITVGRPLRDLLEAADMMQLWSLAGACVGVLVSKLTPDTCLDILSLVYRFKMTQVQEQVEVYVANYLARACQREEWLTLSEEEVVSLVGVAVRQGVRADTVAGSLLAWLAVNELDQAHCARLLGLFRLEELSSEFLCDSLMFHPCVMADLEFTKAVKRNIRSRLTSTGDGPQSPSLPPNDSQSSITPQSLASLPPVSISPPGGERMGHHGEGNPSPSARPREVMQVQPFPPSRASPPRLPYREQGALAAQAGPQGEEVLLEAVVTSGEEGVDDMSPPSAVLVVGGPSAGGEGRAFVKAWLLDERRWISLADCPMRMSHGCASVLRGHTLYLTGGRGSRKKTAMLNLQQNAWAVGPELCMGRFSHGMAASTDHIYVAGGCSGYALRSVERRSPLGLWQDFGLLQVGVQDCGVGIVGDIMVVLGGEGVDHVTCYLQTFNLRTRSASIARTRLPIMATSVRFAGSRVQEGVTTLGFVGGDGRLLWVSDTRDNIRITEQVQLEEFWQKLNDFGAILDGEDLVVCGGFRNGVYQNETRAYNLEGHRVPLPIFRQLPVHMDVRGIVKAELPFLSQT